MNNQKLVKSHHDIFPTVFLSSKNTHYLSHSFVLETRLDSFCSLYGLPSNGIKTHFRSVEGWPKYKSNKTNSVAITNEDTILIIVLNPL